MGEKPYSLNFSLEGKTALITGAAKGIGKAIAQVFSEYKANIILVDLNQEVINVAKSLPGRTNQNLPIIAILLKILT